MLWHDGRPNLAGCRVDASDLLSDLGRQDAYIGVRVPTVPVLQHIESLWSSCFAVGYGVSESSGQSSPGPLTHNVEEHD